MQPLTTLLPWSLLTGVLLSSCSSPPQPPSVDEALKRPANAQAAVDLQVCRSELQNTRIQAAESSRRADSAAASLAQMALHQEALAAAAAAAPTRPTVEPNSLFSVRFDFGSTRVAIPGDAATALIQQTRSAPLVLLRGRTDGATDTPAESRIARERATAVRDYLVAAGVDPARIRATYQPAGDHVADNGSASGRRLNRRVEIEVYRALPVAVSATPAARP